MKIRSVLMGLVACGLAQSAVAATGDLYIYPAKGQAAAELERDRYECYVWASRETGFDPATTSAGSARLVRVPVGENDKEGAALAGTIIGAIAGAAIDDSSRGAAVGAGIGTLVGAAVENDGQKRAVAEAQAKAKQISEAQAAEMAARDDYRRAFSACLEGRGYVVR